MREDDTMLKKITFMVLFALAANCNAEERREEAIQYLKGKNYELGGFENVISNIVATNITVDRIALEKICDIGTVKSLFFRSSRLEKGAVRGLEGCDTLEYIRYEKGSTLPLEDIPDHDLIPKLAQLAFWGKTYGDDLMPYLAKLNKIPQLDISGSLTADGIRRYVEVTTVHSGIRFAISSNSDLDDSAFEHFLKLKGLKYIDFGTKTGVTEEGVARFGEDYMKKYGVGVTIVYGM